MINNIGNNYTLIISVAVVIMLISLLVSTAWQAWMLQKVYGLTNSNFHEAKSARISADAALKVAQDLNIVLENQLKIYTDREKL